MQFTATIITIFAATAMAAPAAAPVAAPAKAPAAAVAAAVPLGAGQAEVPTLNKRCDYGACAAALGPTAVVCLSSEEAAEIPCIVAVLAQTANPPASCGGC